MKIYTILLFTISFLSCGCVSTPKNALVIDVPFQAQEQTDYCGVVSLAMSLDYYNIPYNFTNLVNETYIPALNGSSLELIASTANKYGLDASIDYLTVGSLQQVLESKAVPIIYLYPLNDSKIGHFAVLTGISLDRKKMRIHHINKPNIWIKSSKLTKRSHRGVFPTVILSKPQKFITK